MMFWLIWVAVLGFRGGAGFDFAEEKPGLILMPIRPWVPACCLLVFYFDFGFFEAALNQECWCCVSDTTVISPQPEYTELEESTFLFGDLRRTCCQQAAHVCIFALHQLKLIQTSPFWESLCQEMCLDCRASEGTGNVSPARSSLLTLGDFLPGYVFDSCSGVCAPSHWPDNHHEANYSHRQLMFPCSGSHGNDSTTLRISVKSVTFGNRSLRRELGSRLHQLCPIKLLRHGKRDGKLHVS